MEDSLEGNGTASLSEYLISIDESYLVLLDS